MRSSFFATALVLLGSLNAHAYTYDTAKASFVKPLAFQDANGKTLNLTSGDVSVKLNGRPLWGSDTLQIKTIQGTVVVKIPKADFSSGWNFSLPAGALPYALRGTSSDQVTKGDARDEVRQCSVDPIQLPVTDSSGQPVMERNRTDLNNQPLPDRQLVLNLCAHSTNGKIDIKQANSMMGCDGSQHVQMQQTTTTPVYSIEILDPSTGASLGRIDASSTPMADDLKVKDLTSCQ